MTTILKTRRGGTVFGDYGHGSIEADPTRNGSCFTMAILEEACGTGRVDRKAGIIRGVKILGRHSANGREYSQPALEQAAKHYDGMRVNIDHPDKKAIKASRGTLEQWGWLEGIQVKSDGVYGDLHFLKTHPDTAPLLELAERRPDKFGLSHNADCSGFSDGRKQVIESVDHVRSVDLVQRPATNMSLFESYEGTGPTKTLRQLLSGFQPNSRASRVLRVLEMDGMVDMGNSALNVSGPPGSVSEREGGPAYAGFKKKIIEILNDNSIDIETTLDQVEQAIADFQARVGSKGMSTPDAAITEGLDGHRGRKQSAPIYGDSKGMAAAIRGKTPAGPPSRSGSVLESYSAPRSRLKYQDRKELARMINGKTPTGIPPTESESLLESNAGSTLDVRGGTEAICDAMAFKQERSPVHILPEIRSARRGTRSAQQAVTESSNQRGDEVSYSGGSKGLAKAIGAGRHSIR